MRQVSGQKGAALVVVLAIVVMSTAMFAVVLHFLQRGTEVSGLEQKYETAKDASLGALDVFAKDVIPTAIAIAQVTPSLSLQNTLATFSPASNATIGAGVIANDACFSAKLLKSSTPLTNWTTSGCTGLATSTDPKTEPDVVVTLSGTNGQPFRVYTKIVDTISGNSNTSAVQLEGESAAETAGNIPVQHFPYMYSMEVQGERQQNPSERANFEVLYAY